MDLEFYVRRLLREPLGEREVIERLSEYTDSTETAEAIVREVALSENVREAALGKVFSFERSGVDAKLSGLGCRGEGDFFIHHKLAEVIGRTGAVVDSVEQDDAGAVETEHGKVVVAVDGMHSRLSHFPFLAGFHAARAALRDIAVMGTKPVALVSDIHLANDGDVAKVFDYTAGVATVGELLDVPLVSGSTLRIGGDMVLGDRLTGCVGAVGVGRRLTPRRDARPGDLLLMSEGSGGGTIASTAIYNGRPEIVEETINIDFLSALLPFLESPLVGGVHSMTDITNGGIRGDAFEISNTARVRIVLDEERMRALVNARVLGMLDDLGIDYLGVSIDSLLIVAPEGASRDIIEFVGGLGLRMDMVGRVEEGSGVFLERDGGTEAMAQYFREAPYTPVKRVMDVTTPEDWRGIMERISAAAEGSREKKRIVRELIERGRAR